MNYRDYDHQWGPLCRECGTPFHWLIPDLTKENYDQPMICKCTTSIDCELCGKPLLWRVEETGSTEEMFRFGRRDSVFTQGVYYWWECEDGHPTGPPPTPGIFARNLLNKSEEMMQTEGYDELEAEGLLERSIDIYARMGLTIAAIELSMKLAMLVQGRAQLSEEHDYVSNLLTFALDEIKKPGYKDEKQQAEVTLGILEGYIGAELSARINDSEGVERGIEEIEKRYNIAKKNEYRDSLGAAEYYLPKAQNFRV